MSTLKIVSIGQGGLVTHSEVELADEPVVKMGSGEIKEDLESYYRGSKAKDWKRVWKRKVGPFPARLFANDKIGVEVLALAASEYDDDDDVLFHEVGKLLFYVVDGGENDYGGDTGDGIVVMFAPETHWKREHSITDQHFSVVLEHYYNVPVDELGLDEVAENQFVVEGTDVETMKDNLTALGFTFEPEMARAGTLWKE